MLLTLGVEKEDKIVCSLMVNGLTRDYNNVRENIRIMYPRNREAIDRYVRDKYLELSIRGRIERQTGQAWVAQGFDKGKGKGTKQGNNNSRNQNNRKPLKSFRCGLPHMLRDRQARVIKALHRRRLRRNPRMITVSLSSS